MKSVERSINNPRLVEVLKVLQELSKGNLTARGTTSDLNDDIDAIISGLNLLGEELQLKNNERDGMAAELYKEKTTLDNIIHHNPYSMSIYDAEGHFLRGNQAHKNLFGSIPPSEYSIFNDPILKREGLQELILTFREGKMIKDPIEIWYNAHEIDESKPNKNVCTSGVAFPILDPDGKMENVVVIHEDITERKRVDEARLESEERYRVLVETLQEGLGIVDQNENIFFANPAFCRILGYSRDELIGMNLQEIVSHDEFASVIRETETRKLGKSSKYELKMRRKDGELRNILINAAPWKDIRGDFKGTLGLILDVTDSKEAIEALERSERQASAAIEAARALTFNYDIATGKIIWGGAIEEITGYTPEEFTSMEIDGWAERIHPDDRDNVLEILADAVHKEDRATAEYRFRTRKGYVTLSSVSLTEKENGRAVRLVGILRDITERKKMEEKLKIYSRSLEEEVERRTKQLLQTKKLASIGQLVAGIAHEINSPLAVISLYTELIEKAIDNETSFSTQKKEELKSEYLDIIISHVNSASKIVSGLLDFTRISRMERMNIDINEIILKVINVVKHQFDLVNINIELNLDRSLPMLSLDPSQIQQVMMNIILNTYNAIGKNGTISILTEKYNRGKILVKISDNGSGIALDAQDKVFEPFYTTSTSGGTGLGLSITKEIVESHGGEIDFESSEGEGTAFFIRLPVE